MEFFAFLFCILLVPLLIGLLYVSTKLQVKYLTSQQHFRFEEYQRIVMGIIVGLVVIGALVGLWFPGTLSGNRFMLSGPVGFLVGLFFGVLWQIGVGKPIPKLFKRGLFVSGLLALLMVVSTTTYMLSALQRQKTQMGLINSLRSGDIPCVKVQLSKTKSLSITAPEELVLFKKFLCGAELCAIRKNSILQETKIEIQSRDDNFVYEAFVPAHDTMDIILRIPQQDRVGICLPGLKQWLDENVLKKEK